MLKLLVLLSCAAFTIADHDNVICPDGQSMCFRDMTCCLMPSGLYGCCPFPHAVCCQDHIHCCPQSYTCNLQNITCDRNERAIPMLKHRPSMLVKSHEKVVHQEAVSNAAKNVSSDIPVDSVQCPGGESYCPDGNTCCLIGAGLYACCPLPEATCCEDKTHCCPNGYKCEPASGGCVKSNGVASVMKGNGSKNRHVIPMLKHRPSLPVKSHEKEVHGKINNVVKSVSSEFSSNNVQCPGGESYCADGSTCCPIGAGLYACCPLPEATCCEDKTHCCPHGYKCETASGGCVSGSKVVAMMKKTAAIPMRVKSIESCDHRQNPCKYGNTCCPFKEGDYGCCPMQNAVCCPDKEHCCPHGFRCNDEESRCTSDTGISVPYLAKLMPKQRAEMRELQHVILHKPPTTGNMFCPDRISHCPETFTCCKGRFGFWECCPLPKATCCNDGLHCCPHGTKCDVITMKCKSEKYGINVPWLPRQKAKMTTSDVSAVLCPDGVTQCLTGNTCCLLTDGMYGCCPYSNAVCCSDHIHCCPYGTICNVATGQCLQGTEQSWMPVAQTSPNSIIDWRGDDNTICPDHVTSCPSSYTCCQLQSGAYGCCPYEKAVCCSDKAHCCPYRTICDTKQGKCTRGNFVAPMRKKIAGMKIRNVENVVCPDGTTSCDSGYTCCKLASGGYGCCPYKEAVCCSDGKHCCPHGTKCNLAAGTCERSDNAMLMKETIMPVETKDSEKVVCPDGATSCPSGYTCCKLSSGSFGCCPYENAVCCSDGKHCCPHGTKCNLAAGTCDRNDDVILMKQTMMPVGTKDSGKVVCPDGATSCPSGYTCCKLSSGSYGCCPYEKAVCCSDGKHCCPHGTKCNLAAGTCDRTDDVILVKETMMAVETKDSGNVVCPDGVTSCPSGYTCCKLSSGSYGCCPYENAVCCSDGKHCCPHGTKCNLAAGTCDRNDDVILMKQTMMPVGTMDSGKVVCPDGATSCPSGYTCCKLSSGSYGCCPYEKAVCCSDGKHCCPHGTKCNLAAGTCDRTDDVIPMKETMMPVETMDSGKVVCPDAATSCPSGYTCCKLSSGSYGCCPYEKAVCCSDGKHCCPHGTKCNLAAGTCDRTDDVILMKETIMPVEIKDSGKVVCPDAATSCPSGYTCCKLASGDYGCCPHKKAVCCNDGKHCCPHGTKCNLAAGTCDGSGRIEKVLPEMTKITAVNEYSSEKIKASEKIVKDVTCPDKISSCPSHNTCCKLSSGEYGCCPMEHAVCCSDGEHCCPSGTRCNLASSTCVRGNSFVKMFKKTKALKTVTALGNTEVFGRVTCPDLMSFCPQGYTCCKLSSGDYGCCPYSNAVCCSDKKHCCPHGMTCDLTSGHCLVGNQFTALQKRVENTAQLNSALKKVSSVICPGGRSQCPDKNTCCPIGGDQYGCCPQPNAVCCSDKKHCCPSGYICGAEGYCTRGILKIKALQHTKATQLEKNILSVACPGGEQQCPDGDTCCPIGGDLYGCCPVPNAVCCSDKKHCCPSGYTCGAEGYCTKGVFKIKALQHTKATKVEKFVTSVACPGGEQQCPDGYTCCPIGSDLYGCCPFPNAVCCSDKKHCCPSGYTCDAEVACPGGKQQCPDGDTCCPIGGDLYGCCPLPNAVCCSDKKHCCPSGYTCGAEGYCTKGVFKIKALQHTKATKVEKSIMSVACPGGEQQCPDGYTCCPIGSDLYGCCPFPNAVCCSDKKHCCPSGYTCDAEVACPGGKQQCPDGDTCCPIGGDLYGCCPLPNAVCCSDKKHCCPSGYTCGAEGYCTKGVFKIKALQHTKATKVEKFVTSVACPGGEQQCPDGYTCCPIGSDLYGCCPFPNAVCCSDKKHCCPSGYTCDAEVACPGGKQQCPDGDTCCPIGGDLYGCCPLPNAVCCSDKKHCCPSGYTCGAEGYCTKGVFKIKALQHTKATKVEKSIMSVACPGGEQQCPDGYTCCPIGSDLYGCCPFPNAVCCSDKKHCCPSGYTCDAEVACPGGKQQCPDGDTCCPIGGDLYGCCPLPNAVCCSDKKHCCPSGYTCGAEGYCTKGVFKIKALQHTKATKVEKFITSVACPGGEQQCPDGYTCCPIGSDLYGCCPFPKAVCCSDKKHCCPSGYTCGEGGYCTKGALRINALQRTNAKKLEKTVLSVICPGGEEQCPNGYTCCPVTNGKYGCCPISHAVCCPDKKHCCPSGFSCSDQGFCVKGFLKVKGLLHIPSTLVSLPEAKVPVKAIKANKGDTKCPDKETTCLAGTSCCQNQDRKSYSCCPIENAVCCPDHIHCCPNGWRCDIQQGACRRGNGYGTSPLLAKIPGKKTKDGSETAPKYNYIRFT